MQNIKNLKLSQRERVIAGLTLVMLVFGFFKYWYAVKNTEIQDLKSKISIVESNISKNQIEIAKLSILNNQNSDDSMNLTDEKKQKNTFSNHLSEIIGSLNQNEKYKTFTLLGIELSKTNSEKYFDQIDWLVDIESTFLDLGHFIEYFEQKAVFSQIQSVDISRPEDELQMVYATFKIRNHLIIGSSKE